MHGSAGVRRAGVAARRLRAARAQIGAHWASTEGVDVEEGGMGFEEYLGRGRGAACGGGRGVRVS